MTRYNHFLSLEGCQEAGTTQPPKYAHSCHRPSHDPRELLLIRLEAFFLWVFVCSGCLSWSCCSRPFYKCSQLQMFGNTKTEWIATNFCFCPSRSLSWVSEHWTKSLIKLGWDEILNTEQEENQFNSTKHNLSVMIFSFTHQYKTQTIVEYPLSK